MKSIFYIVIVFFTLTISTNNTKEVPKDYYYILLERESLGATDVDADGNSHRRLKGKLSISKNNMFLAETYLGETIENCAKRVPPGIYKGNIRRQSTSKKVVVNSEDILATKGDFYLEVRIIDGDINDSIPPNYSAINIDENKARTNILFHSGNKAYHSEGCILTGAFPVDGKLTKNHLLKKLKDFIMKDDIMSNQKHDILIEIRQNKTWDCK